jgi:hypothetical protein
MVATGVVNPVVEWEETVDGRRRPSDTQAKDVPVDKGGSGLPLWAVEVTYRTVVFDKERSVTAPVTVPAAEKPEIADYTSITFGDLTVTARSTKAGGFVESWRAGGLASFTPIRNATTATGKAA